MKQEHFSCLLTRIIISLSVYIYELKVELTSYPSFSLRQVHFTFTGILDTSAESVDKEEIQYKNIHIKTFVRIILDFVFLEKDYGFSVLHVLRIVIPE